MVFYHQCIVVDSFVKHAVVVTKLLELQLWLTWCSNDLSLYDSVLLSEELITMDRCGAEQVLVF